MSHPRYLAAALAALGLSACSALAPAATSTPTPAPTATSTITPSPTTVPSPTPLGCLTESGSVTRGEIPGGNPIQEFLIYLPPCYEEMAGVRYPVLYLLHGQNFKDDQWVHLGANVAADNLIHRGEAEPFIIVFPDDRYWNLPPGTRFGRRLIEQIIPFVDGNYRTQTDRSSRALGGLSRGAAWAVHYALTRYDLFGIIGLHSPVIFGDDAAVMHRLMQAMPATGWPHLWMDAGDRDGDLTNIRAFEALLTQRGVPHEWHIYAGDHTEVYWQAHVTEYIRWYAEAFSRPALPAFPTATAPTATPTRTSTASSTPPATNSSTATSTFTTEPSP